MLRDRWLVMLLFLGCTAPGLAEAPVASYIFPAGGQRGTTVKVRVGGLFLGNECAFDMIAPDIKARPRVQRTTTPWFEGPLLHLPDSQRAEDYPKDMAGEIAIGPSAKPGLIPWRLATSQGATASKWFQVGDLPEVLEDEIEGDPIPVGVKLPVTINGRIFPRQDVDAWAFALNKGKTVVCEVQAARLGSPLEARLEIVDEQNRRLAESDLVSDPRLAFTAPTDGTYQVRIHDVNFQGSQAHVYRLSLHNGPYVERTFPLGGQRGQKVSLELIGHNVSPKLELNLPDKGATFTPQLPGGNTFTLDLDDLPEVLETKDTLNLPAMCNGRIARPGEVDDWTFAAKKGDAIQCELRAARLGSALDGILTIHDAADKELARADAGAPDPSLRFTAPADGTYRAQVRDRFRSRGGPDFAYRLRLAAAQTQPDFRLQAKIDALSLVRGTATKLSIQLERLGGFQEPVTLDVKGLPPGVNVSGTTISAKQNAIDLLFKTDADAKIQHARVTIQGSARIGDTEVVRLAESTLIATILVAVSLPTPFKIKGEYDMRWASRGSQHQRRYQIERNGFDGPLEISLADRQARHLQGVTGPVQIVPAEATEFDYTAQLPPWMETGRTSRVCVMARGIFKDTDGSQHEIFFSSTNQNEQMVAVIEPGKLDITLEKSSLLAAAHQSVSIPFKVARGAGLQGSVRVELVLPAHLKDVRIEPVMLSDKQSAGTLQVQFGAQPGPFNMPLLLRATLTSQGRPHRAETHLEVTK